MPSTLSTMVQAGLPTMTFGVDATTPRRRPSSKSRSARRWSCASRSASWGASHRGTTRCTRSRRRSRRARTQVIGSSSSPVRSRHSTRSSSPRSSTPPVCPRECSTSLRARVQLSARPLRRTPMRHGVVHRFYSRRPARFGVGGRHRQARRARTRRQVAEHHPRRRRPRARHHRWRRQVLSQLGPDVQCSHAHAGAAFEARGSREDCSARRRTYTPGDPFDSNTRIGPLVSGTQATACAATSRRESTKAPSSSPAAPRAPRRFSTTGYFRPPDGVLPMSPLR